MPEFIPAVAQLLLSCVFGAVLFYAWRKIAGTSRPIFWLVTAGLVGRALAGQVLFWISWLRLPLGRSLQVGDGFWFFALDATYYFDRATDAARAGVDAIVFLNRTEASVFYIQTLATFAYLFGSSPAVALLLNIGAYLGICAIVLKLAPPQATRSRVIAIAALSLTPSVVLWALQPLKDVYFLFLVALFIFACDLWQRLALRTEDAPRSGVARKIGVALLMGVAMYAVSGIRWYFGMALVAATGLFLLLTIVRAPRRRALVAASAGVLVLMLAAFRAGGGPYIPEPIRRVLTLNSDTVAYAAQAPRFVVDTVERSRRAFESAAGATTIGAPKKTAEKKPEPAAAPPPVTATVAAATPVETKPEPAAPPPAKAKPVKPAPAPVQTKPTPVPTPAPVQTAAKPAPPPAESAAEPTDPGQAITLPTSPLARFASGMAAVVLPKTIAEAIGLFEVGGGRGLWVFVEIDTLVFDVILLYALWCVFTTFRTAVRTPSFWLVLVALVLVAVPLMYTVSNFGTLFRHRNMITIGLVLLPLTIAVARRPTAQPEPVA